MHAQKLYNTSLKAQEQHLAMAVSGLESGYVTPALLFGVTFAAVLFLANLVKSRGNYRIPKGPTPLPFFGNALSLKENDEFLHQLTGFYKEYGPIYSLYLGRKRHIVVNDWETIRGVTVKGGLDFGDRPVDIAELDENPNLLGN